MAKVALKVSYLGEGFSGFQYQPDRRTVQGEIERALGRLFGVRVRVKAAGRTDAGVNAEGQVVAFDLPKEMPGESLVRALNHILDRRIRVLDAWPVPGNFDPRRWAISRLYKYRIYEGISAPPWVEEISWVFGREINLAKANRASAYLLGTHDFSNVVDGPGEGNKTRTVFCAYWKREDPFVVFNIRANAFLYHMVRVLVWHLVKVGSGELTEEDFLCILEGRKRRIPGLAPARGLSLVEVEYGGGREHAQNRL